MAGFIHGEVNWLERVDVVEANVRTMVNAVRDYPWTWTSVYEVSPFSPSCVVAVQNTSGRGRESDVHGGLVIAADIHLHGRDQLVSQLEISPADGHALSDETLIEHAYRRWGLDFAGRIMGEGTFALWDYMAQRIVCWRDAAGVRPFYYHHVGGSRFVFSSDLQSLAAHPATPNNLDIAYTHAFLRSEQFQHPTRTLLDGALKLPAAHILVLDRDGLLLRRYWDPRSIVENGSAGDADSAEELRELLRLAVADRIGFQEGQVGAHLSGGLDSSSVALTAAGLLQGRPEELPGFSWAPPREIVPKTERDERDLVEAAAGHASIRPNYTRLTPADVVAVAYRDVALRPRETLYFEVATSRQAVDAGTRLMLSGWGGDEMIAFNGRGYFADLARRGRLNTVRRELSLRSQIQGGSVMGAWKGRVVLPLLPEWVVGSRSKERSPLPGELRPDFARALASAEPLRHDFPRERPGVHRMQAALLEFGHLQYRMETWAAHGASLGLVYTFPLLDRRIMELALTLPGRMFFRHGWKRWLYRTAMEGLLPDVVRWNPKKYDDAAGRQLRSVLLEPADVYRDPLVERRDNAFIDIDILLAAQDRHRQVHSSSDGDQADGSPASPIGGGAWLAFTRLRS